MFFPLFILIAGILMILEYLGIIPTEFKWGLPLFLICSGIAGLVSYFKTQKINNEQ